MRCGGCGSKVGASTLSRVLQRLRQQEKQAQQGAEWQDAGRAEVLLGLAAPDDAAVIRPPPPGYVTVRCAALRCARVAGSMHTARCSPAGQ